MAGGKRPPPPLSPREEGENPNTKSLYVNVLKSKHLAPKVPSSRALVGSSQIVVYPNPPPAQDGEKQNIVFGSINYPKIHSEILSNKHGPVNAISQEFKLKPKSIHQGKPSVVFQKADKQRLLNNLPFVLVGKFSHGRPTFNSVKNFVAKLQLKEEVSVSIFDSKHLFLECLNFDDFATLWMGNIWSIDGYHMRMFKWSEKFNPSKESSISTVWIHLPGLPLYLFDELSLLSLGNVIGKPLKVDIANINRSRLGCASICVEMDVCSAAIDMIWVEFVDDKESGKGEGFWQKVIYGAIPSYCSGCSHLGHKMATCKRQRAGTLTVGTLDSQNKEQISKQEMEEFCHTGVIQGQSSKGMGEVEKGNEHGFRLQNCNHVETNADAVEAVVDDAAASAGTAPETLEAPQGQIMTESASIGIGPTLVDDSVQAGREMVSHMQLLGDHNSLETEVKDLEVQPSVGESTVAGDFAAQNLFLHHFEMNMEKSEVLEQKKEQAKQLPCSAGTGLVQLDPDMQERAEQGQNFELAAAADSLRQAGQDVAEKESHTVPAGPPVELLRASTDHEAEYTAVSRADGEHQGRVDQEAHFQLNHSQKPGANPVAEAATEHPAAAAGNLVGLVLNDGSASGFRLSAGPVYAMGTAADAGVEPVLEAGAEPTVDEGVVTAVVYAGAELHTTKNSFAVLDEKVPIETLEEGEIAEGHLGAAPTKSVLNAGAVPDCAKVEATFCNDKNSWAVLVEEEDHDEKEEQLRIIRQLRLSEVKEYAKKDIEKIMGTPTNVTKVFDTRLPIDFNPDLLDEEGCIITWSQAIGTSTEVLASRSLSPAGRSSKKLSKLRKRVDVVKYMDDTALLVNKDNYDQLTEEWKESLLQTYQLQREARQTREKAVQNTQKVTSNISQVDEQEDEQKWTTAKRRGRNRNKKK